MTPEEVLRMPFGQHQAFIRYQNYHIKQVERARR